MQESKMSIKEKYDLIRPQIKNGDKIKKEKLTKKIIKK